ncbi:hypothetical protein [Pseudomonas putida]|uniref:hypothetical protein n=1 Tax=Pseudomonas putida TaxID=303 RepID=UPI00081953DA|nr:hypothetical protein [Pseudomonas putida]OCT30122.1 hypothetical protein A6E20_26115 [Pseudomonas putida]OCT32007.1 hypothetical protein A6E24_26175 [Pseudomonas putida]OCT41098.1 hypothetical protein A6E19_26115 [Pseudomonas putida]
MYSVAVGWLGWAPDVAWSTPLPELFLAMDARVEWARMTNPFGSGKSSGQQSNPKISNVADKLRHVLTGRRAN